MRSSGMTTSASSECCMKALFSVQPTSRIALPSFSAFMQHSLLALVVIPELRISDEGIVDVRTFEKVDLFV